MSQTHAVKKIQIKYDQQPKHAKQSLAKCWPHIKPIAKCIKAGKIHVKLMVDLCNKYLRKIQ